MDILRYFEHEWNISVRLTSHKISPSIIFRNDAQKKMVHLSFCLMCMLAIEVKREREFVVSATGLLYSYVNYNVPFLF